MIYFASDFHLHHKNIIRYSNRPFSCLREMNDNCFNSVNKIVKPEDTLVFLGDFMFAKDLYDIWEMWNHIKCNNIIWLMGNHDTAISTDVANQMMSSKHNRTPFIFTGHYYELRDKRGTFICSHYPMLSWNKENHGSYMLHGHCHANLNHMNTNVRRMDVGYDSTKQWCISIDDVVKELQNFKPQDRHERTA